MELDFGTIMKALPEGYTLKQLAKDVGVSQQTIQNWKNGNSQPYGKNLRKLLQITKLSYLQIWKS